MLDRDPGDARAAEAGVAMIRARNAIRPDAACHSADVLTPPERTAENMRNGFTAPQQLVYRDVDCKWGDIPELKAALLQLLKR